MKKKSLQETASRWRKLADFLSKETNVTLLHFVVVFYSELGCNSCVRLIMMWQVFLSFNQ